MRITMFGAGSGFTPTLTKDIMLIPNIKPGTIALVDVDPKRLELSQKLVEIINQKLGRGWKIEGSTDRKKVLKNSDYVINTIEVSGVETVRIDNDIPLRYGVSQCIGDTIGPGGIFKALRTVPKWLEILKDVQKMAPNALVLNYTNPMSIMTLAGIRYSGLPMVGLCHSVQGSSHGLAHYLEVPYEELYWKCAGINHNAWYTVLEHKGKDMYPELKRRYRENPEKFKDDLVRMEFMDQLGYYVTESSGHFSEYVPWFRKRKEIMNEFCRPGYSGGESFYADNWPNWRKGADEHRAKVAAGEVEFNVDQNRSHEFASIIIEAHLTNKPCCIHGNVINTGLVTNLPEGGCVEVPVMVDKNGYNPCYFGDLPEQCAAVNRSHMAVHELVVSGILNKCRESVTRALMLDPLTSAVCSLAECRKMFDEMWEAEKAFMPELD